jgi:N-acetylneuraminic acid mutarotase
LLAAPLLAISVWAAPAQAAPAHPAAPAHADASAGVAATAKLKPVVRTSVRHDTSPKLRTLKPPKASVGKKVRVIPLLPTPTVVGGSSARARGGAGTSDVQRAASVTTDSMPSFGQDFDGIGNVNGAVPPDTNMAVGSNDVVQTVNTSFAVYGKQGNTLLGPETLGTLWQGFGGQCDPDVDPEANGGDVVALYDEQANRFIITQLAFPQMIQGSGGYHECIAVSQTGDPTGAWYRYDFLFSNNTLNDYPKWAVWPDAYYMSNNDFLNDATFTGVTATAFDRTAMLAGQQATSVQFTIGSQYSSLLPSNAEGAVLGASPPAGAPNPYFMSCDAASGGPCSSDQLDEWNFHVDWSNPASSTFGSDGAPSLTLPVAAFNSNMCNFSRDCISQPGTNQGLDPISDRLMYQSAYRVLSDGTQALVLNQTVNVSASGGNQAGVRWYELTNSGSGWTVAQQGTYAPDSDNRWMGSANIDVSGDIAIGYSVSSATTFPSIRVAGRLAGDPDGQLSQGEETMIAGSGSQTSVEDRWGDYSVMQVDPADGCTFWYTTEYYSATSNSDWQTRIGSFRFPSCSAAAHGDISGTVTDSSTGNPIAGATVSTSLASTTTDSQGKYDLELPVGTYDVSFHAFGYADKTDSGVQASAGSTTTDSAVLAPEPSVHVTGTVTDGSGHGWPLHASIDITGRPGAPIWTNPATGSYSVDLPENASYAATVASDLPGYQAVSDTITVGGSDLTHNISVPVEPLTCNAPGYKFNLGTPALNESFDGATTLPAGWATADNSGTGGTWQINDPLGIGNGTGGSGNFADINGQYYGRQGLNVDASLITPALDLSAEQNPILEFSNNYVGYPGQTADIDVSTDGGQTWTNVWEHTSDNVFGPDEETIRVPQAAGDSSVEFRFHYSSTQVWGGWWQIDNVVVQDKACGPMQGRLVLGRITDANTGKGLNGVAVTDADNPPDQTTTAFSADPAIGDGYYSMFAAAAGSNSMTAAATNYQTGSQAINVAAGSATVENVALKAGQLSITPSLVQASQVLGVTTTQPVTIKNTGTAPASVSLIQQGSSFQVLTAHGAPLRLVHVSDDSQFSPGSLAGQKDGLGLRITAGAAADPTWSTIAQYPTAIVDNSADIIDGHVYSVGGVDSSGTVSGDGFDYDPVQNTWTPTAAMPVAREKPGAAAANGKLYVTGGWDASGTTPVAETDVYDPDTNTWSTVAANPSPTAAPGVAVADGKIYLVGGCMDSQCTPTNNVEVYDTATSKWSSAAPYPQPVSWVSCGAITGKVYCAGGLAGATTYSNGYVYDPGSNSWSPIASMPIDLWGSAYGAANGLLVVSSGVTADGSTLTNQGYSYDPADNSWTAIPNAQYPRVRGGSSCGFYKIGGVDGSGLTPDGEVLSGLTQCGGTVSIPWLTDSPASMTLQPGQSVAVTLTLSATTAGQVTQPGTLSGQLGVEQDTPYDVSPVDVVMQVTPPKSWGKISGTLSGEDCTQTTAPLRGVVYANGTTHLTLPTGADGTYAFWAPKGKETLEASAAGWIPQTVGAAIQAGKSATVNFTLRPTTC